jgi:hypothetical protein
MSLGLDASKIVGGAGVLSGGDYVTAGGAGTLLDWGHQSAPLEVAPEFENQDFESERAQGPVKTLPSKTGFTIKVPLMQAEAELMRVAFGQPAANKSGSAENFTLRIGDRVEQYHQVTIVTAGVKGPTGVAATRTVTFWKLQIVSCEPVTIGKAVLQQYIATFRVMRDDSVSTADKYFKQVDTAAA